MSAPDTRTQNAPLDEEIVWYSGGDAYHADAPWGPACPDVLGSSERHTLADAERDGKRPCEACQPIDHRSLDETEVAQA